jgi:CRP/FNR family cyclic AMP-dependent transcriptional regulator
MQHDVAKTALARIGDLRDPGHIEYRAIGDVQNFQLTGFFGHEQTAACCHLVSIQCFGPNRKIMAENDIREIIAESRLFAGMPDAAIDFLAAHSVRKHLDAGQVLFHHGARADRFYLMLDGHLSLEVPAIEGPSLQLQDIGPGQTAGWSWAIPPHRWHFQARAKTGIDYLEFDGDAVLANCEADPEFGYQVIRRFSTLMSERLDFARQRFMQEWKPLGFA